MTLALLKINNLRNIEAAEFSFHPHINLISGFNGSGKTSFLEAIYLLGSGHSFRTREISPLIQKEKESLTVFGKTFDAQTVSLQKSLSSIPKVRMNSQICRASSELARSLPCQVLYQDIFQIIDAGPAIRRSLLDWGLFHVKHHFHQVWKKYNRGLKQRNCLLRNKASQQAILPWDKILSELAEEIHSLRKDYFSELSCRFQSVLPQLTPLTCSMSYYKGWDKRENAKTLESILFDNYKSDSQRQFTQYGPHQADLLLKSDAVQVKHHLSRGEQKILLIALKLAQSQLLDKNCLFLCDDLTIELDEDHLQRLLLLFKESRGQFFITTIKEDHFQPYLKSAEFFSFQANKGAFLNVS